MIKNSIYKSELVEWRTIQDLQPELLPRVDHRQHGGKPAALGAQEQRR